MSPVQRIRPYPGLLAGVFVSVLLLSAAIANAATAPVDAATQAALAGGLRPTLLQAGEPLPHWSLPARMAHHRVPGVAIAVLRDGKVVHSTGYGLREAGTRNAVDADTLFSVGSVSKVVTAAATLRLVDDGTLDLDRDVDSYLSSWQVPASAEVPDPVVTLRMLMSHTAGLNVHGFADYQPGEALPTLLQIVEGQPPARNKPVRLIHPPGERGDYSGGGVMIEQLVLEDATGSDLESIVRGQVFGPLGMRRSTFANPLPAATANVARAHDGEGAPTALPRGWESFPEQAASGLWTSGNDLAAFVAALLGSYRGDGGFLHRPLAVQMMTEVSPSWHGLGPRLDGAGEARIFHHGGSNDSYRAWIEGYLETGDGFVILSNGANGGALVSEIRNALSDAIGRGVNPPIRAIALDLREPAYADYAGTFVADPAVPMDLRRALADLFDIEVLEVTVADGRLGIGLPGGEHMQLMQPLAPNRFASPDPGSLQVEFHRNARGKVNALSVEHGAGRMHYTRREPGGK